MLDQLGGQWASWIPRTTPLGFAQTVSRQVTLADGGAAPARGGDRRGSRALPSRPRLGRLWLALGVLPFALAAVIGVFASFLFDRTLTLASWAPLLALAFLLDAARAGAGGRSVPGSWCAAVLIATVGSCTFFLDKRWDYDLSVERLEQVARPGDVIAVRPARYGILVDWRIGVRGDRPTRPVNVPDLGDADTLLVGARSGTDHVDRTGRVWLLTPLGSRTDFPATRSPRRVGATKSPRSSACAPSRPAGARPRPNIRSTARRSRYSGGLWRTRSRFAARASTTCATSTSSCRATSSSCSPGSRARGSRRSRSTPSTPRASAATSSRCRRTPGSSSGRWTSPTSTSSRACRPRSRSTRSRARATRGPPSAPSPRSTTTSGCSTRASASRTARSAAGSSPARPRSRSSTACCSSRRARASRCSRRSCAAARASTRGC